MIITDIITFYQRTVHIYQYVYVSFAFSCYSCLVTLHPSLFVILYETEFPSECHYALLFNLVWQYHSSSCFSYVNHEIYQEKRSKLSLQSLCLKFPILVVCPHTLVWTAFFVALAHSCDCLNILTCFMHICLRIAQLPAHDSKPFLFLGYCDYENHSSFSTNCHKFHRS
jgi:hypothetical protein